MGRRLEDIILFDQAAYEYGDFTSRKEVDYPEGYSYEISNHVAFQNWAMGIVLKGSIDDFMVYDMAVNDDEMEALYRRYGK